MEAVSRTHRRAPVASLAGLALLLVHFTAELPEERYLAEQFGDAYGKHAATVSGMDEGQRVGRGRAPRGLT